MSDTGNETTKRKHVNSLDSELEKDDSSSDDEDEDEDETEKTILNPLSFTENSNLYVISIDGVSRFYVKDESTASEKMWDIARRLSGTQFLSGYRTAFLKISNNELHLVGYYRFFLVSYETVLHRISYSIIQECV
jgi:hypothetical protein